MKRIKSVVLALSLVFVAFGTKANTTPDEGMWLPMLINKNYDEMKKIGFKLSADDIYNVNHSSLKDNVKLIKLSDGDYYIIATKFIPYNTEILINYDGKTIPSFIDGSKSHYKP